MDKIQMKLAMFHVPFILPGSPSCNHRNSLHAIMGVYSDMRSPRQLLWIKNWER